ncbi:MAG: DUF2061 domain-containing protein [Halieaceae bacterium]|jgi:uncharacterized membrane protein|nr:DUF2061 domain-containing protein [Halieaceae bacterium]
MIKTASFAIVHFSVAFGVAFALTGSVVIGGLVALVEPMINTVAYHFHEKAWERIRARRPASGAAASRGPMIAA